MNGTIAEEMQELGIQSESFETVYQQLKEHKTLPSVYSMPWQQYRTIVDYLHDKKVLGENNEVNEGGLKFFETRRKLEGKLEDTELGDNGIRRGGGVLPCRHETLGRTNGGVAPCRDYL